ncbi:hypothetical protein [Mycobacterium sp. NPDC004974]
MALIVTFIGSNAERVSIVIPPEHTAEQIQEALARTPGGQWAVIPGIVDGQRAHVYVRPDRYGMFFLHEVDDAASSA